jgi:hypothetical protein
VHAATLLRQFGAIAAVLIFAWSSIAAAALSGSGSIPVNATHVGSTGRGLPQATIPSGASVVVFTPRNSQWAYTPLKQVKPGSEFTYRNHLYRVTDNGVVKPVPGIDVNKLADADRVYDSAHHRPPKFADVVMVLGSNMRFSHHAVLSSLQPGVRVCFQGRVYDLRKGIRPGTMSVTDTGVIPGRVVRTYRRKADTLVDLRIRSADGAERVVSGTPEHPFYVPAVNGYVPMGKLTSGTVLKTADGRAVTVVGSAARHGHFAVFNFQVQRQHNYYVSDRGVLVHNQCSLGSSANGTTSFLPRNLSEQLAAEEVPGNPTAGYQIPVTMNDSKWLASDGWSKYQQTVDAGGGVSYTLHYVYNTITGVVDDIKVIGKPQ